MNLLITGSRIGAMSAVSVSFAILIHTKMLIQTNQQKLGDKSLSPQEALKQSFEQTDSALQRYRLDDHEDLKNMEKRMGKPMTHADLINKVERITGRTVWAEQSNADKNVVGFYRVGQDGQKEFLVAFDKGVLPEFSYILVDTADLPIKEKRGWRTVLHRLLHKRALQWRQVVEIFGDTHGWRWRMNTRDYRT